MAYDEESALGDIDTPARTYVVPDGHTLSPVLFVADSVPTRIAVPDDRPTLLATLSTIARWQAEERAASRDRAARGDWVA